MPEKLDQLKQLLYEVYDLNAALAILGWDQQTYMPRGGSNDRGHQMSTLARLAHQKSTSPEIGRLLEELTPLALQMDPDSNDARLILVTRREYDKASRITSEWVAEFTHATTLAESIWEHAKETNDFSLFQPHLEKVVEMRRQYADFFKPYDHVYDPLLDDFEPGLKTAEVQEIFSTLRPHQIELIQAIKDCPQVDDSFLRVPYEEKEQWDFGVDVISHFGFDWQRGRQDKSMHPFTTTFGADDVRITTRFEPSSGVIALFSTMHEGGHALYEQGFSPDIARSPLAKGASSSFHESQSRMFENLVGRSLPFWKFFYPRLQKLFPSQLGSVDLFTFYKGINRVQPSFIRVEADEATYNLHIMLRMELEIALMEGSLAAKDLPEAWNSRMQEYLGITPINDSKGVLQDIHWSGGSFGYFPTYALGNLISVQIWNKMEKDIPDVQSQIEKGVFEPLLDWLRVAIHSQGAKYEPQAFIQKITGSKIDPLPYIQYLKSKYSQIYPINL